VLIVAETIEAVIMGAGTSKIKNKSITTRNILIVTKKKVINT
jgi:hypothetical protein